MTFVLERAVRGTAPEVSLGTRGVAVGGMVVGTLIAAVLSATPQLVSSSTRMTLGIEGCQERIDASLRKHVAGFVYQV